MSFSKASHVLFVLFMLLDLVTLARSQTMNFNCDFDGTLTGDCKFTNAATGPSMTSDQGAFSPSTNPKQPYSDAKAVRSLTAPNNEPCIFPYPFPSGGWDMYFCRRFTNGTATCPTATGSGRCNAGKYGLVKLPATGASDFTFYANVLRSSSTRQCLDFYYYITDTSGNARMELTWETDDDLDAIVEVSAVDNQNKWQHRRVSFDVTAGITAYKLMVRVRRDTTQANFVFALDEVQIIDAECDSSGTTPIAITTTTTIATTTTPEPTTTTPAPITTTTTTPVPTTTTPEPTTTTTPVPTTTTPEPTTTTTPVPTTTTPEPTTTTTPVPTTTTPEPTTTTTPVPTTTTPVPTTTTPTTPVPTTTTPVPVVTTTTTPVPVVTTTTTPVPAVTTTTTVAVTTTTTAEPTTTTTTPESITNTPVLTTTTTGTTAAPVTTTTTTAAPFTTTTTTATSTFTSQTTTTTTTPKPTTTTVTTTSTTTTTTEPARPLLVCDFTEVNCFPNSPLIITNGTEVPLLNITEPPRAPLSDASSITKPTSNSKPCSLPYQLPFENSTVGWDMWFCYDNECPTQPDQHQSGVCASGNYGLIFVDPAESNKTMSTVVSATAEMRSASDEHCLMYSYYMTVYDKEDWDQQLSVWTRANDSADDVEADRVKVSDMRENRWYTRRMTVTAPATKYTITFLFEAGANASTRTKTVYFGVDNIELYNRKCEDATVTPTVPPTTTIGGTNPPPSKPDNLALILGLSLGIGIPALLIIVIGGYCYATRGKRRHYDMKSNSTTVPVRSRQKSYSTDIPLQTRGKSSERDIPARSRQKSNDRDVPMQPRRKSNERDAPPRARNPRGSGDPLKKQVF